ncbi:hypothetical protein EYF80_034011 [Liparis tanakae]|uniref:Uncharacterized protein n=1 Tax=Liparis tanakae TaxID=230148 RepID=A0A4Z2GSK9_9TELE|nr:hypothetical protein EYF80_034011 [Liparis tanakae]
MYLQPPTIQHFGSCPPERVGDNAGEGGLKVEKRTPEWMSTILLSDRGPKGGSNPCNHGYLGPGPGYEREAEGGKGLKAACSTF